MRTALKTFLLVAMAVIVTGMMKCTISSNPQDETCGGGGTGSECGIRISGLVQEPCGNPAQNALITMRPHEYLALQRPLGKRITKYGYVYVTASDSNGRYSFTTGDSISEGVYCIEALNEKTGNCLFIDSIIIDSQILNSKFPLDIKPPYVKTDNTLKPPGAIKGTIQLPDSSNGGMVFVYGLNTSVVFQSNGNFNIENLPAGNLRLHVIVAQGGNENVCSLAVTTVTGTPTLLDTLYGVFYNGNENTGGSIPSVNRLFSLGDTIIIPGNTDALEKSDSIFIGWNTRADGSGEWYNPGDMVIIDTAAAVFYAQWASKQHLLTITDSGNGTISGSDTVAHGVPHVITAIPDSGSHFSVWRVTNGEATITDSFASSTTVILDRGDAAVEGVFKLGNAIFPMNKSYSLQINDIQPTNDGGYIMIGYRDSSPTGFHEVNLFKINAHGNLAWTKTFGLTDSENVASVWQTSDDGYIISGTKYLSNSNFDVYVIKTDVNGDVVWSNTFGGNDRDEGFGVRQTSDGGYIVTGYITHSDDKDACLIKISTDGDEIWTKTFGEGNDDEGHSVKQTADGGYIITGFSSSLAMYLIKTDAEGDTVWTRSFGGSNEYGGLSVKLAADGGYIIVGGSYLDSTNKIYLVKTDVDGAATLINIFGGNGCGRSDLASVQPTGDGGFIIVGNNSERGSCHDSYLVKIDQTGNTSWIRSYADIVRHIVSAQQTSDGGYAVFGSSSNADLLLIKTDENGNIETGH